MTDFDMIKQLYKSSKNEKIEPNKLFLNTVLEASIRTDDSELIYNSLKDFIEIKQEPHQRLVNLLNNIKHIPDRLFVLLRENFGFSG